LNIEMIKLMFLI